MPENTGIPIDILPPEQQQMILAKCNSQACKDAKAELERVRNSLIADCGEIKRLSDSRNFWTALAGVFYTAAGALAATAASVATSGPYGWIAAIIIAVIALIMFIIATIFANIARNAQAELDKANTNLAANQQKFNDLVTLVQTNCDMDYCPANLTIPACP